MNISHVSSSHRRSPLSAWRLCLVLITLFAFGATARATDYFVDQQAAGGGNGLTQGTAWNSIAQVTAHGAFNPGDRILFNRGDTFVTTTGLVVNGSGTSTQPITYGVYPTTGTAKATIDLNGAANHCMTIFGRNWITVTGLKFQDNNGKAGILIREGGNHLIDGCEATDVHYGLYVNGSQNNRAHDIVIQNCHFHDLPGAGSEGISIHQDSTANNYPVGDNFLLRNNVCSGASEQGFDITSGGFITLEGNVSTGNAQGGLTIGHNAHNVTVRYHYSHGEPTAATGSNLKISVDTVTVEYSKFVGNSFTGSGSGQVGSPVVLLQPTLYQSGHPLAGTPDARPENVTLRNNTFVWNDDSNADIFRVAANNGHTADIDNLTMKNNIWANRSTGIPTMNYSQANRPPNYATYAIRNNLYDDAPVTAWRVGSTNYANFAAYKAAYNPSGTWLEKTGNPSFVNAAANDYHLASTSSPAYNAAENIGLTVDFDGVAVPQGGARDMGLYELPVSGPPSAPTGLTASAPTSSTINLSWTDTSNNETGFEVDRALNSGFSSGLVTNAYTTGAGATGTTATGLSSATTYYFRARATNGSGDSANSNTASAMTSGGSPVTYQAESQARTQSAGDTTSLVVSNTVVLLTGNAVNDWVEYTLNVATAGTYNVKVGFHRNAFRAIAKLLVGAAQTQVGSPYDTYSTTTGTLEVDLGNVSLAAGNNAFRFQVTGRNPACLDTVNYQVAVDYIKLTP